MRLRYRDRRTQVQILVQILLFDTLIIVLYVD